ncbi:ACT domain-containing protein [Leuconostocaceae bacterium ESL0723]|nr:ACT domain-containing protein [Lactobacillaceae bacterium L1_55_11]WEV55092.1 ACT domain-containing protein [Leuconostocaceae bacterium ESL0723]
MIQAVVTVVGRDKNGIVAAVAKTLSAHNVNIIDMSQTIMTDLFTMNMLVEWEDPERFNQIQADLTKTGEQLGVTIHIQREEIFDAMSRV